MVEEAQKTAAEEATNVEPSPTIIDTSGTPESAPLSQQIPLSEMTEEQKAARHEEIKR